MIETNFCSQCGTIRQVATLVALGKKKEICSVCMTEWFAEQGVVQKICYALIEAAQAGFYAGEEKGWPWFWKKLIPKIIREKTGAKILFFEENSGHLESKKEEIVFNIEEILKTEKEWGEIRNRFFNPIFKNRILFNEDRELNKNVLLKEIGLKIIESARKGAKLETIGKEKKVTGKITVITSGLEVSLRYKKDEESKNEELKIISFCFSDEKDR